MTLSHYMQPWILPPGINFFLIALGFLFWFYSKWVGRVLMMVGVVSLWLFSLPIVAYYLIDILQNQYPILSENDFHHPSREAVILVLGGGDRIQAEYGNKLTISDATLQRLNYAVFLQKKMHLPLILSGGKPHESLASEAELMAAVLWDQFKIKPIGIENKSSNTEDESRYVKSLLKQDGFKTVYLVTNAWHMPRSVEIFQCAGMQVVPAPMGHILYGPGYASISYFPNMQALYTSSIAMHELIGLMWYRIRFYNRCE